MYVGVDPGKRNGVATFSDKGEAIKRATFEEVEFLNFLQMLLAIKDHPNKFIVFVVEDYKLRQDKALDQIGSDIPAARMVGAVQMTNQILGDQSNIVMSPPAHLRTALKWAGFPELANKPRNWHCPDDISAYAHCVKHLIDMGLRKHPIFND